MGSASERMCYIVTPPIDWAHTQHDPGLLDLDEKLKANS